MSVPASPLRRILPLFLAIAVASPVLLRAQASDLSVPGASGVGPSPTRPVPRERVVPGRGDIIGLSPEPRVSMPELLPVYFPATIPVLGSELPPPPAVRDPLWNDFAAHTNELFFAPLSTRLADGSLHRRLRQRLEAYQTDRAALLTEVRDTLEAGVPVADAAAQETRLAALLAAADTLRRDLYAGGFLVPSADWNQHRNWRLGDDSGKRSPQELLYDEMSVLRAAIYYQEGLSAEQRELLREIVMELAESVGGAEPASQAASFELEQTVWFLPHGSRLRLPADLPAGVAADVASLTAEKNALKRELRHALYSLDREGDSRRERALEELAVKQEPRFALLPALAERIRLGLAARPESSQAPAPSWLPPELAARIAAYLRAKAGLQTAARQAEEVARAASDSRSDRKPSRDAAASSAALVRFEEQNRQRFTELASEARAIREAVARAAANQPTAGTGKSVDALLADFATAFKQQQLQSAYEDYRTAVLRPGLTSAQRQLLFNAALAGLDLTGTKDWQAVPE